jgi:Ca2+-binding EF-hand superfamily protein
MGPTMKRLYLYLACAAVGVTTTTAFAQEKAELPNRPIKRSEVVAVLDQQFKAMDTNHDGKISRDEFEAYRAKQAAGETSSDLSAFAHVGAHWFDKNDTNGDGFVSRAEAAERPLKMFDMADANQDGVISLKERSTAMFMMSMKKK